MDLATLTLAALVGVTLLLALWYTTVLAALVEGWRLVRRRTDPAHDYATALTALAVAVGLTIATPWLLTRARDRPTTPITASGRAASLFPPLLTVDVSTPALRGSIGSDAAMSVEVRRERLATLIAVVWLTGVLCGLIRLAVGWLHVSAIRRRATPVSAPALVDAVTRQSALLGIEAPMLLQSAEVDAPVVVGAHAPAVIVPHGATSGLRSDQIAELITHELAHVRRRDYAVNLAQVAIEALLWFSPGVWWLGRRIRHAREFCCDDIAVGRGGGAGAYIEALTTMAALSVTTRRRVPIGAAGPRLIERVRRQLQEDAMLPYYRLRVVSILASVIAIVALGPRLFEAALTTVHAAAAQQQIAQGPPDGYDVPYMYPRNQPGSSVSLMDMDPTADARCGVADVRNDANVPVSAIQFIAIVHSPGANRPASIVVSSLIPVTLAPGDRTSIDVGLVSTQEAFRRMDGQRAQIGCALGEVHFANGATWVASLNPTATNAENVLALQRPELSRAMLSSPLPSPNGIVCLDQREAWYSPGAIMTIEREPGAAARCERGGRWTEVASR